MGLPVQMWVDRLKASTLARIIVGSTVIGSFTAGGMALTGALIATGSVTAKGGATVGYVTDGTPQFYDGALVTDGKPAGCAYDGGPCWDAGAPLYGSPKPAPSTPIYQGDLDVKGAATVRGSVTSSTGNLVATAGDVQSGDDLLCGDDVVLSSSGALVNFSGGGNVGLAYNGTLFSAYNGSVWTANPVGNTVFQRNGTTWYSFDGATAAVGNVAAPTSGFSWYDGTDAVSNEPGVGSYSNTDVYGPAWLLVRGRGTHAAPAVVQTGDFLGEYVFEGQYDSTVGHIGHSADMRSYADGAWGSGDYPGRLEFWTVPDGSSTNAKRMTINAAGVAVEADVAVNGGSITTDDASCDIFGATCTTQALGFNGSSFAVNGGAAGGGCDFSATTGNLTCKGGFSGTYVYGGATSYVALGGVMASADIGGSGGKTTLTSVTGVGNAAAANIQAPGAGTGTGPATPGVITGWIKMYVGTTAVWVPYAQ